MRHGLTATTLANPDEVDAYKSFEAQLMLDFLPCTGIQRELVERLASLLWRLRRATAIENGLLRIQQKIARERMLATETPAELSADSLKRVLRAQPSSEVSDTGCQEAALQPGREPTDRNSAVCSPGAEATDSVASSVALAFLRLANLDNQIFERLGRYETRLWRQAAQTLLLIESITKNGE